MLSKFLRKHLDFIQGQLTGEFSKSNNVTVLALASVCFMANPKFCPSTNYVSFSTGLADGRVRPVSLSSHNQG